MKLIIEYIVLACVSILAFSAYVTLMSKVYPKYIARVHCSENENFGRGLKRYVYPEGRGILYEPHPSARKYVRRYLLFTANGYKYLKCLLDNNVRNIGYSVIMMNNRNRFIDVLDVEEKVGTNSETEPLLLHPDTSYVAFILNSAGNRTFERGRYFYYTLRSLILYALAVAITSYSFIVFIGYAARKFCSEFMQLPLYPLGESMGICIAFSLIIGLVSMFILISFARKKGIKVVK